MKSINNFKKIFLAVTVTGSFMAIFESSTINVALYKIAESFQISLNEVQLITSLYILIYTIFLPLFGKISDLVDRNKLYAYGFLIFGLGAFLNTISPNFIFLLTSRCIEALGGSILISNSNALITLMFKNQERGQALGILGASVALGGISGPAISGALIQFCGWHTIFIPSIIIGILGTIFSLKYIPSFKKRGNKSQNLNIDWKGFIYFSFGLISLFSVLACQNNSLFIKNNSVLLCIFSAIFWYLFYKREEAIKNPLINLSLFKNRTFVLGCFSLVLWFITAYAHCLLFPFTLQEALNYQPFITGLLMLPFSIMVMIVAPFSGKYAGAHSSRNITIVGCLLYLLGFSILLVLNQNTHIIILIISALIMGIGNGLFQPPTNTALMSCVPKEEVGTASGVLSLARNAGMILGIALALGLFDVVKISLIDNQISYNQACVFAFKTTVAGCLITILIACISVYFAYDKKKQS